MSLLTPSPDQMRKVFTEYLQTQRNQAVFEPIGGTLVDQLYETSTQSLDTYLRKIDVPVNSVGQPFSTVFGYADVLEPTAFAHRTSDHYVMGMNASLVVAINELALFCFAQKDFFPEIGDGHLEVSPTRDAKIPPGLRLFIQTLTKTDTAPPQAAVPIDPNRHVAAMYLSLLMMRFAWFHEMAHGLLGHTDYLIAQSKAQSNNFLGLDELNDAHAHQINVSLKPSILQILEFEADGSALARSIAFQVGHWENIDGIKTLPPELRLRLTVFGAYTMCWLFESIAATLQRSRLNITHPAPFRRLHNIHNMAVSELNHFGLDAQGLTRACLVQLRDTLGDDQWQQTDHFDPIAYRRQFDEMRDTLAPYRFAVRD